MLNENFVILGVIIAALGGIQYLIKTLQGKTKPNRVTYLFWAFAGFIAFAAEISQGVRMLALLTFAAGFLPLAIFIASFVNKKAEWKLGLFDFMCGILALIGLFLWYITRVGNIAIVFSILADGIATLPTITKSYQYPETEYSWAYLISFVGTVMALFTIKTWDFAHYGFPLYLLISDGIVFWFAQFKIGKRPSN